MTAPSIDNVLTLIDGPISEQVNRLCDNLLERLTAGTATALISVEKFVLDLLFEQVRP